VINFQKSRTSQCKSHRWSYVRSSYTLNLQMSCDLFNR